MDRNNMDGTPNNPQTTLGNPKTHNPKNYSEYHYTNKKESNDMGHDSLNATEIAVGSLLAGGRGGYGGGGAWGGGYGYGPFASPGANAVRLNRNQQTIEDQADCTREVLKGSIDSNTAAFENLTRQNQFNRICDRLTDLEFRQGDRLRDLANQMVDNAKEAAKCCCDAKLLAVENKSEIMAEIKAVEARTIQRDLDRAERRITQLEIFRECGCGCAGGVHPCPQ